MTDEIKSRAHLTTATPGNKNEMALLGSGPGHRNFYPTRDQYRALKKVYGVHDEPLPGPVPLPEKPDTSGISPMAREQALKDWERRVRDVEKLNTPAGRKSFQDFNEAGAARNIFRHVEHDGLRMVAWLSRYMEPGEDPVKVLVRMASEAGFDVPPEDYGWAVGEEDFDSEEEEEDNETP